MKLDAFEKMIRKILREEIEFYMEKVLNEIKVINDNAALIKESIGQNRNRPMNTNNDMGPHMLNEEEVVPTNIDNIIYKDYSQVMKKLNKK